MIQTVAFQIDFSNPAALQCSICEALATNFQPLTAKQTRGTMTSAAAAQFRRQGRLLRLPQSSWVDRDKWHKLTTEAWNRALCPNRTANLPVIRGKGLWHRRLTTF